jgi:hypothetical protein
MCTVNYIEILQLEYLYEANFYLPYIFFGSQNSASYSVKINKNLINDVSVEW